MLQQSSDVVLQSLTQETLVTDMLEDLQYRISKKNVDITKLHNSVPNTVNKLLILNKAIAHAKGKKYIYKNKERGWMRGRRRDSIHKTVAEYSFTSASMICLWLIFTDL